MADEITTKTQLNWSTPGSSITATVQMKEDQITDDVFSQMISAGPEARTVVMGGVTDPKYILFKNTEAKDNGTKIKLAQDTPENLDLDPTIATILLEPQQGVLVPNPGTVWACRTSGGDGSARLISMVVSR